MDCIKNPQPTCANTVATIQQIPTWFLMIMMMNARKAAPGAAVPSVMQNQSVNWNGQQYVVVNVSQPGNAGGIGDTSAINGSTPVRSLDFFDGVAHVFLITMPLLSVWCNS
ncbi:hypothetical protein RvY_02292 [Ramazzottius varieornatus]|uniref:Uncharacterized protein n=1 Tax=Ramazzottius varieornatus TaxID=947166 RepID=A0A1D1UK04_RAMVA|nr:hypothetical protein RvY_02292 [Ramazzottius varieornatus]